VHEQASSITTYTARVAPPINNHMVVLYPRQAGEWVSRLGALSPAPVKGERTIRRAELCLGSWRLSPPLLPSSGWPQGAPLFLSSTGRRAVGDWPAPTTI